MKKIFKLFYILFLFLIWTLVFCLTVEVGTRVILQTANYLYKPLFERQNAKVYRVVHYTEDLKERKNKNLATQDKSLPIYNDNDGRKQQFMVHNYVCDKNYELTLQGKAELRFDKQGNIIEAYGDPIIERYIHKLCEKVPYGYFDIAWNDIWSAIITPPTQPVTFNLNYIDIFSHIYQIEITPQQNEVLLTAKEIRDGYPLSLRQKANIETEESPWLVYSFMYKPNWKSPEPSPNTNSFGFRDYDVILPKPKDMVRIVCVGGSTTEEGNNIDSTYPNIMEQKLKKHFNTELIDVINAGICGGRSFGEVRRIQDYLNLQPDILLYYNAINDICYHYIPFWFSLPNPYKNLLKHSAFLNRIFNKKLLPPDEYMIDYLNKTILRNLGAMNCACKKQGVQMAICSFAYPKLKWFNFISKLYCDFNIRNFWLNNVSIDVDITYNTYLHVINIYNRELKKMCEREGILYIPVAEEFNGQLDHFSDVCHMTPIGMDIKTDIIGSHIARWIKENKWK